MCAIIFVTFIVGIAAGEDSCSLLTAESSCIECKVEISDRTEYDKFRNVDPIYTDDCQVHIYAVFEELTRKFDSEVTYLMISLKSEAQMIDSVDQMLFSVNNKNLEGVEVTSFFSVKLQLRGSHIDYLSKMRIPLPMINLDTASPISVVSHTKWTCGGFSGSLIVEPQNEQISVVDFVIEERDGCFVRINRELPISRVDYPSNLLERTKDRDAASTGMKGWISFFTYYVHFVVIGFGITSVLFVLLFVLWSTIKRKKRPVFDGNIDLPLIRPEINTGQVVPHIMEGGDELRFNDIWQS